MGTTIAALETRIRQKIVDPNGTDFDDAELLTYLSEGSGALRKLVCDYAPELLQVSRSGTLTPGTGLVALMESAAVVRVRSLRVDGELLEATREDDVLDLTETGRPQKYFRAGWTSAMLWPIPDQAYAWTAQILTEAEALTQTGESPWPTDWDDYLVDYAVIRCGMRNEADISQEAQFLMSWQKNVLSDLCSSAPVPTRIQGYW